jgi:hypothetical protein
MRGASQLDEETGIELRCFNAAGRRVFRSIQEPAGVPSVHSVCTGISESVEM